MFNESREFDNQTDAVSIISSGSIDLTSELEESITDTQFARKVLSYRHMTNKVQCLPIGKHDGITVYESFESACKRTFAR